MLYFFIGLIILTALGWVALLLERVAFVRHTGGENLPTVALGALLQKRIDRFYFAFARFFREWRHRLYLGFLVTTRRGLIIFRYLLTRVERRFGRLIEAVHGKHLLEQNGPVSLFLSQLKEPKK